MFKVALLTLFDLPLERFWMWSMDLCAISVIELRGGQPVIRAFNHTGHLAPLLDEAAVEAQEARSRSGALLASGGTAAGGAARASRRKASRSRLVRSRRWASRSDSSRSTPSLRPP